MYFCDLFRLNMVEDRSQLQRYARFFGLYMGIFWIFKFILFPLGLKIPFLQLLFIGLTLVSPFMGYYFVKLYRNKVTGCVISFSHAWIFTLMMYLYASLLVAVAHYLYFRYIDHGFLYSSYSLTLEQLQTLYPEGMETLLQQARTCWILSATTQASKSPCNCSTIIFSGQAFWLFPLR